MSNPVTPQNAREAKEVLLQIAGRRTQPVPAELVVDHVLGLPGTWDWPVRRGALEAVLRRFASVHAEELAVVGFLLVTGHGAAIGSRVPGSTHLRPMMFGCGRCRPFTALAIAPTSPARRWGFASMSARSWRTSR